MLEDLINFQAEHNSSKESLIMKITSAKKFDYGTTFHKVTEELLQDSFTFADDNIFLVDEIKSYGMGAIKEDSLPLGSAIVDDVLYICDTDGKDIDVGGTEIFPEAAIEEVGISALKDYIEDANEKTVQHYITPYEIDFEDITETAKRLLNSGLYGIKRVSDDFQEIYREVYSSDED